MKPPTTLILLTTLSTLSKAFILPTNLADGIYTIPISANGTALAPPTLLSPLPSSSAHASNPTDGILAHRQRRQQQAPRLPSPSTNCHADRPFDRGDYDTALGAFNSVCDRGEFYPAFSSVVVSAGGAMAYLCNYDASNRCWSSESSEADSLMTGRCGSGTAGWVYVDAYKKSYGREVLGVDIC